MIARELRLVRVAIQFLTRLPMGIIAGFELHDIERAAKYFPLAGMLVGVIAAAVLLAATAFLPQPVPVVLALVAAIAITGGLHEDGLADSADGLLGGSTPKRRLEIMKDSRIGAFGVLALMSVLALKAAALVAVDPISAACMLAAAHASARLAPVLAMCALPYVRDAASAKVGPLTTGVTGGEALMALAFATIAGLMVVQPVTFAIGLTAGLAAAALIALAARRRIGGYTGDVLGAIEQVSEAAFMIAAAAVIAGPG